MSDSVQQIKDRLDIVEVISPYVELHKAGRHYKGKSPFTSEKTPSFYVSPDRGMYYCFSTNQGGDMFTFIETMEGVDFRGALKMLAEKAGVELVAVDPKKRDERDTQYALLEEAAAWFFKQRERRPEVDTYLMSRGVEGETVHTWRIGFVPDEWRALRGHLTEKGYTDAQMLQAGLIKRADGGKEPYDVFRDRVMFPIFDASGRPVAFSGRVFSKDSEAPKYVNSPETEFFQKSEILYGYDKARQGIRKLDFSLVVEGQFDVVLSHQAGYNNAVAVSGTAMTEHHVNLLQRLSNRAVLALDADRAGINAMKKASVIMLKKGMDVKVAVLPDGTDPADMIVAGKDGFKKVMGEAKHVVEYLLIHLKSTAKDERAYKLLVREELLPIIKVMPNRIDQEHFIGVVATALSVTKDAISIELNRLQSTEPAQSNTPTKSSDAPVQGNRTAEVHAYLLTAVTILETQTDSRFVNAAKKLQDMLDELPLEVTLSSVQQAKYSFEIERTVETTPIKQVIEDLAHQATELLTSTARAELTLLRQAMSKTEDEAELEKLIAATKNLQDLLQKTIEL